MPLIATHGGAGGRVAAKAYAEFRDELLERLKAAGKVDAVLLALHGAMAAEHEDDADGLELALQVCPSTLLDRGGDLDHLRRAFALCHDLLDEEEPDTEGKEGSCC